MAVGLNTVEKFVIWGDIKGICLFNWASEFYELCKFIILMIVECISDNINFKHLSNFHAIEIVIILLFYSIANFELSYQKWQWLYYV